MICRPFSMRSASLALVLAMAACGGQSLDDARFPTGSQTLTASSDYSRVYVANLDAGTVSVMTEGGDVLAKVDVGIQPTRIARAGDHVLVTLRGERAVAILKETADGLEPVTVLDVGPEPYGVVASEDGELAYVAVSQGNEVVEIDLEQVQVSRRFSVGDQPAFLALHPSDKALYVGSLVNGTFSHIDLRGSGSVAELKLPKITRFKDNAGDTHFFDELGLDGPVSMNNRITGDLSVSPDGKSVAIPSLSLDNTTPVDDPDGDVSVGGGGYDSPGGGIGRFNPGVVIIPTNPSGNPGIEDAVTVSAAASDVGFEDLRSYVNSATFSPDGMTVLASMEGSNAIVVLPLNTERKQGLEKDELDRRVTAPIATAQGPRGVTFLGEHKAFVHTFLDNQVADTNFKQAFNRLVNALGDGSSDSNDVSMDMAVEPGSDGEFHTAVMAAEGVQVEEETLAADVAEGRRMFFAATDRRVATRGGGVSCATCHFESRMDGVTWRFTDGKERQTPSLAGDLTFQERFTWTDNVPSVAAEARLTSVGRMGGQGLTVTESRQIEAFVNSTWYPDTALVGVVDQRALNGKALFEREDVACATCHNGDQLTDQEPYDLFGLEGVRTPSLLGISATAPYLHDGSAATLEQVLLMSDMGAMGDTSMLTEAEKSDLVYYMNTL